MNSITSFQEWEFKSRKLKLLPDDCLVIYLRKIASISSSSTSSSYRSRIRFDSQNVPFSSPPTSALHYRRDETNRHQRQSTTSSRSTANLDQRSTCSPSSSLSSDSMSFFSSISSNKSSSNSSAFDRDHPNVSSTNKFDLNQINNEDQNKFDNLDHHHHHHHRQQQQQQYRNQTNDCFDLFNDLIRENSSHQCLKLNQHKADQFKKIQLIGFFYPGTLIISGGKEALETISSFWSRRILKPPNGYLINFVGFTSGDNPFEITTISQTHFTPLSDALFDCIVKLNSLKIEANLANIIQQLWIEFPTIELPSEIALKSMLSMMCNEKKLVYDPIKLNYNIGDLDSASSSSSSSSSLMPKSSSTTLMGKTIANKLGNFSPKIDQSSSSSSSTSSARNHLDSRERQQRKKIPNNCDSNDNRCSFSPDPNDTSERTKPSEKIEKLNYLIKLSSSTPTATDCSIIDEININCDDDDDDDDADNSGGKLRQEKSKKSSNFNRSRSIRSMTDRNVKSSSLPSTATTSSMLMHANRSSSIASTKTVQQNVTMADDLIIIKRQSLLGRLFRLNSNARIKSSTLPVAICSTAANLITKNFLDFGSQFPDEQMLATQNKSMLIQSINLPRNQIAVNYCSKGTQTVKSGSDEIVTVLRRATMACCRLSSPSSSYAVCCQRCERKFKINFRKSQRISTSFDPNNVEQNYNQCCRCGRYCYQQSPFDYRLTRRIKQSKKHQTRQNRLLCDCERSDSMTINSETNNSTDSLAIKSIAEKSVRRHRPNHLARSLSLASASHRKYGESHPKISHRERNDRKKQRKFYPITENQSDNCVNRINSIRKAHDDDDDDEHICNDHDVDHRHDRKSDHHFSHRALFSCKRSHTSRRDLQSPHKQKGVEPIDRSKKSEICANNVENNNSSHFDQTKQIDDLDQKLIVNRNVFDSSIDSREVGRIIPSDSIRIDPIRKKSLDINQNDGLIMNDSWTVKIEIETINGSGRKYFISNPDDDGNHKDIGDEAFDNLTPTSKSNRIDSQQPKLLEQSNGSYFFSNQSYSPIKFELEPKENASMNAVGDHDHTLHRHDHLFEHCGWQSKSIPQSNSLAYLKHHSPQLNYANSVTALKEQIAKAKANFFKSEQPQFC